MLAVLEAQFALDYSWLLKERPQSAGFPLLMAQPWQCVIAASDWRALLKWRPLSAEAPLLVTHTGQSHLIE